MKRLPSIAALLCFVIWFGSRQIYAAVSSESALPAEERAQPKPEGESGVDQDLLAPVLDQSVSEDQDDNQDDSQNVEQIKIMGTRLQKSSADEASKIEIPADEAVLVAPAGDVAQLPKILPGTVARPQDSEVSIRGSDKNDALYVVDKLQAPNLFEPISGTSVVPSKAIDKLSFYPGNFDASWGNSTAGIIKLDTRGSDIIDPYSEFRLNLPIYVSGYHERPIGFDDSLIVSVRKSLLEAVVPMVVNEDGQFLVPYFRDAYLQHYHDGEHYSTKTRYIHSLSGADVKIYNDRSSANDGTARFDFVNGYDLLGSDLLFDHGDVDFEFGPYLAQSRSEFNFNDIFFKIKTNTLTLPLRSQFEIDDQFNVFVGIQTTFRKFDLTALVPDRVGQDQFSDPENAAKIALDVTGSQREDAAWATFEIKWGDVLVAPGVRVFDQSNIDHPGYDPRLTIRQRLDRQNTAKIGIGQFSQSPQPEELDQDYGNPDLNWIRSYHYMVGWETMVLGVFTSDLQLFYKTWANEVFDDPVDRYTNQTKRRVRGIEWFLRYGGDTDLFGWLSYTYSRNRENRGPDSQEIFGDNDVTHILHLVGNYKLTTAWQLGGRFRLQTGYVYTPINQVWYEANTDTYRPEQIASQINSDRVPDTKTATLFAEYKSSFDTWELVTRFGLEEYQFTKSSPNFEYNYDYSQKEFTTGLPVIPFVEWRAIL